MARLAHCGKVGQTLGHRPAYIIKPMSDAAYRCCATFGRLGNKMAPSGIIVVIMFGMKQLAHIKTIVLSGLLLLSSAVIAQDGEVLASRKGFKEKAKTEMAKDALVNGTTVRTAVHDGDTMPLATLPAFTFIGEYTFKNKRERWRYKRLVKDVKKVLPYATLASTKLTEYEDELANATKRERRKYYRKVEKALDEQYGEEIRGLSVREGRILIRLIDRQTGDTSYELVQELRNGFTAFCFQGVARLFGHNLKNQYNPEEGEDAMIEHIIKKLEAGQL